MSYVEPEMNNNSGAPGFSIENSESGVQVFEFSNVLAGEPHGVRLVRLEEFEPPFVMSAAAHANYVRRFATLFIDGSRTYRGGNGKVLYALNSRGEQLALKMCLPHKLSDKTANGKLDGAKRQSESDLENTNANQKIRTDAEQRLRHEYEIQRSLSGLKGIPQVYGWAQLDGNPIIVMEWIEGVTLSKACQSLAVDDEGRLSPLTAARIGRDLFDLLSRMDALAGEFVHRDISPANILVRTSHLSINEQAEEGVFDLCLIDFGSAVYFGESKKSEGALQDPLANGGAVSSYAAPELLEGAPKQSEKVRTSPLLDVYAASSVLFELVCGRVPFQSYIEECMSGDGSVATKQTTNQQSHTRLTYKIKTKKPRDQIVMAHRAAQEIGTVLSYEPEVAVVASMAAAEFSLAPDAGEVRESLALVDEQLEELIDSGLQVKQSDRPLAGALRDALATFCFQYADNVGRALRGEPLVSCLSGNPSSGFGGSPLRLRNLLRSIGKAASAAVWLVSVVATGILVNGADATWGLGDAATPAQVNGVLVACALAMPRLLGLVVRGKEIHSLKGFVRGSAALFVGVAAVVGAGMFLHPASEGIANGLAAALFASTAAAWCPLVVDFALAAMPARRRKMLKVAAERYALESGAHEIEKADSMLEGISIEEAAASRVHPGEPSFEKMRSGVAEIPEVHDEEITFEVLDDDEEKDSSHDGK